MDYNWEYNNCHIFVEIITNKNFNQAVFLCKNI